MPDACRAMFAAAAISLQPLASPEVLEPSVLNEVEHALSRVPEAAYAAATNLAAKATLKTPPAATNAVATATDLALALVSSQRADGRWLDGTNDCTAAAARMLLRLAGRMDAPPEAPRRKGNP